MHYVSEWSRAWQAVCVLSAALRDNFTLFSFVWIIDCTVVFVMDWTTWWCVFCSPSPNHDRGNLRSWCTRKPTRSAVLDCGLHRFTPRLCYDRTGSCRSRPRHLIHCCPFNSRDWASVFTCPVSVPDLPELLAVVCSAGATRTFCACDDAVWHSSRTRSVDHRNFVHVTIDAPNAPPLLSLPPWLRFCTSTLSHVDRRPLISMSSS